MTPKRGRPRLADADRRTVDLFVRLTERELEELRVWAEREGVPLAAAVRDAALRAARWRP